jgi:hypothetical protein
MKKAKKFLALMAVMSLILASVLSVYASEPVPDLILDKTHETNGEIVVNGEIIEAPPPSVDGFNGTILVPLRKVAEALELTVTWYSEDRSVIVDSGEIIVQLWIDGDYSLLGSEEMLEFGPSPQLIGDYTYVPYYFFRTMFGFEAAIVNGQIVFGE